MKRHFLNFNKVELISKINKIEIDRIENQVVTKYDGRVVSISNVSGKYEVFDIKKYLIDKIDLIESNFPISKYFFKVKSGIQQLILLSDIITIDGIDFYKSFFILNSTDRSRKLSFNAGLFSESKDLYIVSSVKNIGLTKKHLSGITKSVEEATMNLDIETFDDQVSYMESLIGHKISLLNLYKIIVPDKNIKSNHLKFDAFRSSILYRKVGNFTGEEVNILRQKSETIENIDLLNKINLDAFTSFQVYLQMFGSQDSHVIKNETEKIMNITQYAVRNKTLELLGI